MKQQYNISLDQIINLVINRYKMEVKIKSLPNGLDDWFTEFINSDFTFEDAIFDLIGLPIENDGPNRDKSIRHFTREGYYDMLYLIDMVGKSDDELYDLIKNALEEIMNQFNTPRLLKF